MPNAHPDVTLPAVVGRAVPGNEEVVAFVQRRPGAATTAQDLGTFVAGRLAPCKRPAEIVRPAHQRHRQDPEAAARSRP